MMIGCCSKYWQAKTIELLLYRRTDNALLSRSYFCRIDPFSCLFLYENLLQHWCNPSCLTGLKAPTNYLTNLSRCRYRQMIQQCGYYYNSELGDRTARCVHLSRSRYRQVTQQCSYYYNGELGDRTARCVHLSRCRYRQVTQQCSYYCNGELGDKNSPVCTP